VLDVIPAELAHRGMLVPVDRLGKLLTLAMACPVDTGIIKEVEEITGLRVKSMLTTVEAVRRMIETCYPQFDRLMFMDEAEGSAVVKEFENLLATNEVARRVLSIDSFAPPSSTTDEIRAVLDAGGNGTTLRAVADMISLDPVSTTMILRVSNSDAYGFSQRVDGLGLACTLLGPQAIGAVVQSIAPKQYRGQRDGFDYDLFWSRARFCAEAAQSIAMHANAQTAITAYTAALVHDIGRLGLLQAAPKSYPALTEDLAGPARADVEMRVYHLTSTETGYMLARKWGLPSNLAEAVRYHREPERARNAKELTNIVALAVMMADAFERDTSFNLDRAEGLSSALKLSRAETVQIFQDTRESVQGQKAHA
jgi:HD-like signal output (HDOD) protein